MYQKTNTSTQNALAIPVCKKKYTPFIVKRRMNNNNLADEEENEYTYTIERMYGCHVHSKIRKTVIQKLGERPGWEPFGQWSMDKATAELKHKLKEAEKQNKENQSSNRTNNITQNNRTKRRDNNTTTTTTTTVTLCTSGKCNWKRAGKLDDIERELGVTGNDE